MARAIKMYVTLNNKLWLWMIFFIFEKAWPSPEFFDTVSQITWLWESWTNPGGCKLNGFVKACMKFYGVNEKASYLSFKLVNTILKLMIIILGDVKCNIHTTKTKWKGQWTEMVKGENKYVLWINWTQITNNWNLKKKIYGIQIHVIHLTKSKKRTKSWFYSWMLRIIFFLINKKIVKSV